MKTITKIYAFVAIIASTLIGCSQHPTVPESATAENKQPEIYPDYKDVTVPCNIAPLNFKIVEESDECVSQFTFDGGEYT